MLSEWHYSRCFCAYRVCCILFFMLHINYIYSRFKGKKHICMWKIHAQIPEAFNHSSFSQSVHYICYKMIIIILINSIFGLNADGTDSFWFDFAAFAPIPFLSNAWKFNWFCFSILNKWIFLISFLPLMEIFDTHRYKKNQKHVEMKFISLMDFWKWYSTYLLSFSLSSNCY